MMHPGLQGSCPLSLARSALPEVQGLAPQPGRCLWPRAMAMTKSKAQPDPSSGAACEGKGRRAVVPISQMGSSWSGRGRASLGQRESGGEQRAGVTEGCVAGKVDVGESEAGLLGQCWGQGDSALLQLELEPEMCPSRVLCVV